MIQITVFNPPLKATVMSPEEKGGLKKGDSLLVAMAMYEVMVGSNRMWYWVWNEKENRSLWEPSHQFGPLHIE